MIRRLAPALVLAAALATPAAAAMTVGQFVDRANGIRSLGMAAMLSPDFQSLKDEAHDAKEQLKAENAARVAHHQRPIACVPEGQSIGVEEMLDSLAALPPAYRSRPLKDGYARVLATRFPCGR